jgi:hypothetical protein
MICLLFLCPDFDLHSGDEIADMEQARNTNVYGFFVDTSRGNSLEYINVPVRTILELILYKYGTSVTGFF